ncbi:MAG TPA: radical SAM protein [Dongiaceae bacterium]
MTPPSTTTQAANRARHYFEQAGDRLGPKAESEPVCLYLETTNRCNLLCTTCPRTFEDLEPPADMSWELFTSIVGQFPRVARVVMHGIGEPMMVRELPAMIRHLKQRNIYALFNTNGTLLTRKRGIALIESGLDELRVSLDAAEPRAFKLVRGRDMFDRIVRNLKMFTALQREMKAQSPVVSLWLTGLKETIGQLPDFVRLAADIGIRQVYLQRLVYYPDGQGLARSESALFEHVAETEAGAIHKAQALAMELGVTLDASGASEPETSLKRKSVDSPWTLCRRPWTLMYFTAHGRAIPCCIAPFSMRGYDSFTLGNATQQSLREIWNGERYRDFRRALLSDEPPKACANCGLRWSL